MKCRGCSGFAVPMLAETDGVLTSIVARPREATISPIDQAAAEWAWSSGEPAGRGTGTLLASDWQFHPLKTSLGVPAVLGIARDDDSAPVAADKATLLATLIGQAALAHERLYLEDEMRSLSVLEERDRLRAALLSSIGHDLRTHDAVLLTIRDRGEGLVPGAEQMIFDTFARGKGSDRHGGSGLGLAIAKGFSDALGIRLAAANHPEGGAIFTLQFPQALIASPVPDPD
jgi:K+-sensing histidine kinase KdpD